MLGVVSVERVLFVVGVATLKSVFCSCALLTVYSCFFCVFLFACLQIKHKLSALSGLKAKLEEMQTYLKNVLDGKLPVNNQVK